MLVQEVMTKDVKKIDCNESVSEACNKYHEYKVGCLVVMDKDINVGILTERDIIERVILMEKNPKTTKVREIMSSNLKTIHALAAIDQAADIMSVNKIKKLPVILNNEIVGIITVTDISRAISTFTETIDELVRFYAESRKNLEIMIDEWGKTLSGLKNYRELIKEHQI